MFRSQRAPLILILSILAGVLVALTPTAPAARASEGSWVGSNYVPLAQPARVFNRRVEANDTLSFSAFGTSGVPSEGTTGLVLAVTGSSAPEGAAVQIAPYGNAYVTARALQVDYLQTDPVSNTVTVGVNDAPGSKLHTVKEYWGKGAVTVTVDVVGYYTQTQGAGSGFVPVRQTKLFDTRDSTAIPAGQTRNVPLTGGIIPAGAASVSMNLIATGITEKGTIVAVPGGASSIGVNPVLTFWPGGGSMSNLVSAKVSAAGSVTFRNTSTASVHLLASAVGYTTSSTNTGAGWHPALNSTRTVSNLAPDAKSTVQVVGNGPSDVPATGAAAVFVTVHVSGTTGYGTLKVWPSGQEPGSLPSLLYYGGMTNELRWRSTGAIIVPGSDGKVIVENTGSDDVDIEIETDAWFSAPTDYTTAGGNPAFSVAHSGVKPCFAYLDPTAHVVWAGCSESDGGEVIWSILSPGHTFRGPVSVVKRPGGRFVVSALHARDGEVWFWEFAHTLTGPQATAIRSYRHVKSPPVAATLPDGTPVGFAVDVEGRYWAINLNVTAPNQPTWKPLNILTTPVVGELSVLTAPTNAIRLAGTTATGDVVTARYTAASTSLDWQSLGATGASGRVALGLSLAGQHRVAVAHTDNTLWSARIDGTTGLTVDGWHQVNTTYDGAQVELAGSPTMFYDPYTGLNGLLFRTSADGTGYLYRISENTTNSGKFEGTVWVTGSPAPYKYLLASADGPELYWTLSRELKVPVPASYQRAFMLTSPVLASVHDPWNPTE